MKNSELKRLNIFMWIILIFTTILGSIAGLQMMYYAIILQRAKAFMFFALCMENVIIFSFIYVLHNDVLEEIYSRKIRGTYYKK